MFKLTIEEIRSYIQDESMDKLLLMTVVSTYPVLAQEVGGLSFPIAICVQNAEQIRDLAEVFRFWGAQTIRTLAEPPKAMLSAIKEVEGGLALYRFSVSRYTEENLQSIVNAMGTIDYENPCANLYVVIAEKNIPARYREFFSGFIFVDSEKNEKKKNLIEKRSEFLRALIAYVVEVGQNRDFAAVYSEVVNFDPDMKIFLAARQILMNFFMDSYLNESEIEQFGENLLGAVDNIDREWRYAGETDSYAKAFRKILWGASDNIPNIMLNRLAVPGTDWDKVDEALFYDESAYYFYPNILEAICKPLLTNISFDYLKNQLSDAGILAVEGRQRVYYTKGIEIVAEYGFTVQKRLMKIMREKIDPPGELTFLEKMMQRRNEDAGETGADSRRIGMDKDFGE